MNNTEDNIIFGLLKFSKEKYISDFINRGKLKFTSFQEFQDKEKIKSEGFRYDLNEGYDEIVKQTDIIKVTIDGRDFKTLPNGDSVKIKLSNGHNYTHICCFNILYTKSYFDNDIERVFNPKLFEFGDSLTLIPNPHIENGFFAKIYKYCIQNSISCKIKKVNYINLKDYTGATGVFIKDIAYEYQTELRIAISLENSLPYFMDLGDLSNIAFGPIKKEDCPNTVVNKKGILTN